MVGNRAETLASLLDGFLRRRLDATGPVPLHAPWFNGREADCVRDCIETGWVSSAGGYVDRFERQIADACGARFGAAVVNGTCGLHIALRALGIGHGDLVLCPAISFVATANAIAHTGADPAFVDVEARALGMNPDRLAEFLEIECDCGDDGPVHRASGRRVAALIVVHVFGHPADMAALLAIAERHRLPVVEDAAEALGSRHRLGACGTLGRVGVFSFNGNKILTTGGGGAVVTDDEGLAHRIRHLTTTARVAVPYGFEHDEVGFNYRLPNLNAALGVAQMEHLEDRLRRKRRLHALYAGLFQKSGHDVLMAEPPYGASNFWLNALILDDPQESGLFLRLTNARRIETRACWRSLPDLPMYRSAVIAGNDAPVARLLAGRTVNIPSGAQILGDGDLDRGIEE